MNKDPFGIAGDFITAPNISRLFSEMIAVWTINFWESLGSPKKFNLIELGAGNGEMMKIMIESFKKFPSFIEIVQIFITFFLISITWVFFRADTVIQSFNYLVQMINKMSFPKDNRSGLIFVVLFLIFDWSNRRDERNPFNYKNKYFRYLIYLITSYLVFAHFRLVDLKHFIYFQF